MRYSFTVIAVLWAFPVFAQSWGPGSVEAPTPPDLRTTIKRVWSVPVYSSVLRSELLRKFPASYKECSASSSNDTCFQSLAERYFEGLITPKDRAWCRRDRNPAACLRDEAALRAQVWTFERDADIFDRQLPRGNGRFKADYQPPAKRAPQLPGQHLIPQDNSSGSSDASSGVESGRGDHRADLGIPREIVPQSVEDKIDAENEIHQEVDHPGSTANDNQNGGGGKESDNGGGKDTSGANDISRHR
jgi:hypothetical protein